MSNRLVMETDLDAADNEDFGYSLDDYFEEINSFEDESKDVIEDELDEENTDNRTQKKVDSTSDDYLQGDLAVHQYLKRHGYHNPHPTKEELNQIMDKYHNGTEEEKKEAQTKILGIMDPYIFSLIQKKYQTYIPNHMEELVSHGYEGVLIGLKSYNPNKGMPTTWFSFYINHEIQDYINKNISHSSSHYTAAMKKVMEWMDKKEKAHISYDDADIYKETDISPKTIKICRQIRSATHVSIDSLQGESELIANGGNPHRAMERKEARDMILDLLSENSNILTDEEKMFIIMSYGLDGSEPMNLVQMENLTKIPKYRITKIQSTAYKKMREELLKKKRAKTKQYILDSARMDSRIFGYLLSPDELKKDQENVAEYFNTGVCEV